MIRRFCAHQARLAAIDQPIMTGWIADSGTRAKVTLLVSRCHRAVKTGQSWAGENCHLEEALIRCHTLSSQWLAGGVDGELSQDGTSSCDSRTSSAGLVLPTDRPRVKDHRDMVRRHLRLAAQVAGDHVEAPRSAAGTGQASRRVHGGRVRGEYAGTSPMTACGWRRCAIA